MGMNLSLRGGGGVGVLPQENFKNMKCSRSDFRPILGILRAIDRYTVTERLYHGCYRICKWGVRNCMV